MKDAHTPWDDRPGQPHVWRTLGYRRLLLEKGRTIMEWDAGEEYAFPADSGSIVHGGLITTLLDTAMGGACWSILPDAVEFLRAARPGTLRAEGRVVHRTRRIVFCAAEIHDGDGTHLASGRCTQVLRSRR